jgi:hypothetical protein
MVDEEANWWSEDRRWRNSEDFSFRGIVAERETEWREIESERGVRGRKGLRESLR